MKSILVVCDEKEPTVSLQQIPQQLKKCFVPDEGNTFLGIDAGQAEVRVFASLSGDKKMLDLFNSGQDIYKSMASLVYSVPYEEVTDDLRNRVKTCTIALQYGMSTAELARRLEITEAEAQAVMNKYTGTFSTAFSFRNQCVDYATQTGKSPTFFGRYRDFGSPDKMDSKKAGEAFSNLIQGTQADLSKVAMIMVAKYFEEKGWGKMKIQLHDEVLFEIPDEHVEEAQADILKIMKDSYHLRPDWCEFTFSSHTGKNWAEASK